MATQALTKGKVKEFEDIKQPKKSKKIIKLIIILTIVFALIGGLVAILGFNVFNIRDAYLRGALEAIPGVANLLPEIEHTNIIIPATPAEMELEILSLQATITELQNENQQLNQLVTSQAADINNISSTLANFEEEHSTFQSDQEAFHRMVAGDTPQEFTRFFENINPELASTIYTEIIGERANSEAVARYINLFEGMSTRVAADTLQELISNNLDLVLNILEALPATTRNSLVAAMELENRVLVATMLSQDLEW